MPSLTTVPLSNDLRLGTEGHPSGRRTRRLRHAILALMAPSQPPPRETSDKGIYHTRHSVRHNAILDGAGSNNANLSSLTAHLMEMVAPSTRRPHCLICPPFHMACCDGPSTLQIRGQITSPQPSCICIKPSVRIYPHSIGQFVTIGAQEAMSSNKFRHQ